MNAMPPSSSTAWSTTAPMRSEEHTSELQSQFHLVCRLLLEKKNYFDNLQIGGGIGDPAKTAQFAKAAETSFGSYEVWKADFVGSDKMRGVAWAICYKNPSNG